MYESSNEEWGGPNKHMNQVTTMGRVPNKHN